MSFSAELPAPLHPAGAARGAPPPHPVGFQLLGFGARAWLATALSKENQVQTDLIRAPEERKANTVEVIAQQHSYFTVTVIPSHATREENITLML